MVNAFNIHSRVLELERELISAKADFAASKTLRTKLGTTVTAWVTAIVSAIVLSAMALGACVTAIIGTVSLATELVISFLAFVEFCVVSLIKIIEATFVACATVWAIICSLLDDINEIEDDNNLSPMCLRTPGVAPPPSPIPSPPSSPIISGNIGFLKLRDIRDIRDIRDVSGIQQASRPVMCKAPDMYKALDVYKAPIEDVCRGLPYASKEQKRAARIARRAARFLPYKSRP
jgi:hypothetical protein